MKPQEQGEPDDRVAVNPTRRLWPPLRAAVLVVPVHTVVVVLSTALYVFDISFLGDPARFLRDTVDFAVVPLVRWTVNVWGPHILGEPFFLWLGLHGTVFVASSVLYSVFGGLFYAVVTWTALKLIRGYRRLKSQSRESSSPRGWGVSEGS